MGIDLEKFRRDLKRESGEAANKALLKITPGDKIKVGEAVIDEIRTAVAKGISPIARKGRFAAYKWAAASNAIRKVARSFKDKGRRKQARKIAEDTKKNKYPYSVMKDFPNKRERPVNLELSGAFLADLKAKPTPKGVTIGFGTELSELKEQGHREGVNGQPRRPIIPEGDEDFSPSIYRRILSVVSSILKERFKT